MKRKFLSLLIISVIFSTNLLPVHASSIHGHVEETVKTIKDDERIFTKESKKLETTQSIDLVVSQVLNGATSIEGDEFFAEVSQDVLASSGVLLPKGTIAHGSIKNIIAPKRMGRNGAIELTFDYLITPDGREIPIEGGMSSKLGPVKTTAKVIGESAIGTATGGVVGAYAALQLAGIEGAIASHGYTLAGGAAIGGIVALGICLFRKGQDVLISPGDEIKVQIKSSEPIRVMKHDAVKQGELQYDGLDVQINDIFLEKDPFNNLNTISLDLIIKNHSKTDFSSFDIAMINDLHSSYRPSIFSDYKNSLATTRIKRGDSVSGVLSFAVDNPNRNHWLIFYDRKHNRPLAKISIENAKRRLHITDLKKKGKKKLKV